MQGDVVGIVDSVGTEVVKYTYDAWGRLLSKTGTMASTFGTLNPFRYRGYVYDEETGLYYLRSRYYNPTLGRFLNADTVLGFAASLKNRNTYAYCDNNAINQSDASGHVSLSITSPLGDQVMSLREESAGSGGAGLAIFAKRIGRRAVRLSAIFAPLAAWISDVFAPSATTSSTLENSIEGALPGIAGRYENYQCLEAQAAMSEYLKKRKQPHYLVQLYFPNAYKGFVVCDYSNEAISESGFHYGIEYNGIVYCNIYPEGRPFAEWVNSFNSASGEPPIVQKTPIF